MSQPTLSWLQFSDLHIRDKNSNLNEKQEQIIEGFFDIIENEILQQIEKIDFVICPGDITFSGQASEFENSFSFFEKISKKLHIPLKSFYCSPGNHDVNWKETDNSIEEKIFKELASVNNFGTLSQEDIAKILPKYTNYNDFLKNLGQSKITSTDPFQIHHDKSFSIISLNSSLLCCDKIRNWGLIHEDQISKALMVLSKSNDPRQILCIFHHPLQNLYDPNLISLTHHFLQERASIVCVGHVHENRDENIGDFRNHVTLLQTGIGPFGAIDKKSADNEKIISFQISTISFENNLGTTQVWSLCQDGQRNPKFQQKEIFSGWSLLKKNLDNSIPDSVYSNYLKKISSSPFRKAIFSEFSKDFQLMQSPIQQDCKISHQILLDQEKNALEEDFYEETTFCNIFEYPIEHILKFNPLIFKSRPTDNSEGLFFYQTTINDKEVANPLDSTVKNTTVTGTDYQQYRISRLIKLSAGESSKIVYHEKIRHKDWQIVMLLRNLQYFIKGFDYKLTIPESVISPDQKEFVSWAKLIIDGKTEVISPKLEEKTSSRLVYKFSVPPTKILYPNSFLVLRFNPNKECLKN